MQTTQLSPVTLVKHYVSGSGTITYPPAVQRNVVAEEYSTNTLPTGGKFEPGAFRVTAGQHASASIPKISSQTCSAKVKLSNAYWLYEWDGPLVPDLGSSEVLGDCQVDKYKALRDLALTKAFAKLGKPSSELGVEFGELRETLQMLRSPLKGLRDFLSKDNEFWLRAMSDVIKNRRFPTRTVKLTGKTVSDTWLEIRYGIMPFIRTIQNLVELSLDKTAVDPDRITTVGGSERDVVVQSLSGPRAMWSSKPYIEPKTTGMRVTSVKVRAKIYFRRKHTLSVSRQLGLSIVNVPEVFWQLTTCSFIVDWFANVGQYIASFRYTPEIQVLGATVSYRMSAQATKAYDWNGSIRSVSNTGWIKMPERASITGTAEFYQRTIVTATPPGAPRFLTTSQLSIPKAVDIVLIATQRISALLAKSRK